MTMNNAAGARNYVWRLLFLAFMFAFSALMLMPIVWMFSTSLRLPKDSFRIPPAFFPDDWQWRNYASAWNSVPYARFITNSLIISVISASATIIITAMASYSFARIAFPGRDVIFLFFLSGIMIPAQSTLIPRFSIISNFGLVNTRWALILPTLIYPMGIFLVRQYMKTIPSSYDEAAYIDGANRFQIFRRIILPMSVPAVTVIAILHFLGTWNDFLNALIFLYQPQAMTLPLGLNLLKGYHGTGSPAVVLAGVMMSMLVPLTVYIFGQKYLLSGANISGIKA
jgi:multiple sugar transport system permease protein